jgi:hypothetical protein
MADNWVRFLPNLSAFKGTAIDLRITSSSLILLRVAPANSMRRYRSSVLYVAFTRAVLYLRISRPACQAVQDSNPPSHSYSRWTLSILVYAGTKVKPASPLGVAPLPCGRSCRTIVRTGIVWFVQGLQFLCALILVKCAERYQYLVMRRFEGTWIVTHRLGKNVAVYMLTC